MEACPASTLNSPILQPCHSRPDLPILVPQGQKWMQRHAVSLELIAAARGPVEMARAVAAVEGSLAEAGVLSAAWLGQWQPRWRASLAAAPDMHSVLLHVGALQVQHCYLLTFMVLRQQEYSSSVSQLRPFC